MLEKYQLPRGPLSALLGAFYPALVVCICPGSSQPWQCACATMKGKVAAASHYDPLDLFSGDNDRRQQALRCLLQCPQNNLRIFVDGTQLDPSTFGNALQSVFGAVAESQPSEGLVLLVSSILSSTGMVHKRGYDPIVGPAIAGCKCSLCK